MAMEFEVTMADVAKMPKRTEAKLCKKCQQNPPVITTRNEALCRDCFIVYVRSKFTKHMEPFRVKRGTEINRRKIVAATSFGVSSSALLDILHWHRSLQLQRARRAEYDVIVIHVDETALEGKASLAQEHLEKLQQRYPQFEFSNVPLQDIYEYGNAVEESVSASGSDAEVPRDQGSGRTSLERLASLFSSMTSRASQADIVSILRTRLILELTRKKGCEAILFADSMTKMAQMVLAEVTKGRGHALPWLISDGPTPYGLSIFRPFRDIAKTELISYVDFSEIWDMTDTSKQEAAAPPKAVANSKNVTIDELLGQFFGDITNSHLMSNVVKTAAKVELPDAQERLGRLGLCEICQLPMDENPRLRQMRAAEAAGGESVEAADFDIDSSDARIYSLEPTKGEEDLKQRRCYGCRRTTLGAGELDWPVKNR